MVAMIVVVVVAVVVVQPLFVTQCTSVFFIYF